MPIALTDLILHVPGFLSRAACDLLVDEHRQRAHEATLEHCPEASTGVDTWSSFKGVPLVKGTETFRIVHDATETMVNEFHRHLDAFDAFHALHRSALTYSHMYRLLAYEAGTKIHPHIDHSPFVYGSCTFNLNDDYDGGQFAFFRGKHKVALGRGDAMIWPADYFWVHEVEEVTRGVRYSTNSFLQSIPEAVLRDVQDYALEKMIDWKKDPSRCDGTAYKVATVGGA